MSSDPQCSSERPLLSERDWIRSMPVKAMFRPPELADLEAIARAWGVPVSTAVWAIVIERLAQWRRRAPELGPHALAIAAATSVSGSKRRTATGEWLRPAVSSWHEVAR